MEQRQQKAVALAKLSEELVRYQQATLRELPIDLQKQVRSYKALGPITSSGLEHVASLRERIEWAIFYLRDPNFPANFDAKWANKTKQGTPAQVPPSPTQPTNPVVIPTGSELDFGPFDPRAKPERGI